MNIRGSYDFFTLTSNLNIVLSADCLESLMPKGNEDYLADVHISELILCGLHLEFLS